MKSKNGKSKNGADWQKLNEFFAVAVELEPMAQSDFVRQVSDKSLKTELAAMLKAVQSADNLNFLKRDAFSVGAEILVKNEIFEKKQIGKYKIVREIGRGGMGAVFLAEREDFRQQVALKIIKRGMDTDEIIRRFRQERQVLATLKHPNIARLLDGGTTDDGLPFFVMEHIEGETLTKYCDKQKLGIEERLALFRKVCAAVAYAHQNLVVHRDIKPSNILVDADGEPKLLDFGISKLLAPNAFDSQIKQTATGANLMTPEYASPEQIRGENITTASDIYSLGILLYELLSGHRPFRLKNRPTKEILQIISEQEPSSPSTAAGITEEIALEKDTKQVLSPQTIADSRGERPERLRRRLQGDLDNIVLMSLRKEPLRRYSSVEQFSEDLHRHLVGLPVLARPATLIYTTSKFIERNRTTVAFATIALVALFAGLSISIWQAVVARQERERAERRLTEIRKLTNNLVSGWEKGIPETQITNQVRGRIADISSEYLENLANEINNPEILKELAEAHLKLGHEYAWALVNDDKAKASFQKAETIARKLLADNPNDLEAKDLLVRSLYKYDEFFGERDREESLRNHFERLRLREEIYAANPNNEKAIISLSNATHNCGWILKLLGRNEEAVPYYRRSIELNKQLINLFEPNAKTSEERGKVAELYSTVAMNQTDIGDLTPSLENYRRAANIADTLYRENPENKIFAGQKAATQYDLGLILKKTGDFRGSNEAFRAGLETARNQNLRSLDGYLVRKEINFLLDIAENFHELKDDKAALDSLHESFAVWRKYDKLEINKGNSRNLNASAYLFYLGGRLLTRMQKNDEARAAFVESEISYKKLFENNPNHVDTRTFSKLYLTMGDFHAGLGICSFANSPFEGLANQVQYCPSEIKGLPTTNQKNLTEAKKYYENALNILTEMNAKNLLVHEDQENLRIAREKVALCNQKLNSKS